MGDVQNLTGRDAIAKLRTLAKGEICHFVTFTGAFEIQSRPMSTQEVENDGSIWFISNMDSHVTKEVEQNAQVQLLYSNKGSQDYISIEGEAEIVDDQVLIDKYWTPIAKAWFPEGKEDPAIRLICVRPTEAFYWDTKHGKLVSFLKIVAGVLTGKTMDDSVEGTLKV
jgi:general stress protein 26